MCISLHEVRFRQARLVGDFIYQAVVSILQVRIKTSLLITKEYARLSQSEYHEMSGQVSMDRASTASHQHPRGATHGGAERMRSDHFQDKEGSIYQHVMQTMSLPKEEKTLQTNNCAQQHPIGVSPFDGENDTKHADTTPYSFGIVLIPCSILRCASRIRE
ncbi:hypothetical protein [secondary endosymbiont of Ctenarytaina eucalypti]|uniref:Uncharacterized protein n=1 Tax=secondary endosymbiont of Ctenarytaina eucalypti TaxID=1199245 RepID=J3VSH6_9ENTR|nr:hypothetical protein [secondary endosymbiont of Ctenarytaina eucalypti]AFP84871.1 hypothetical protein A359_04780 [secondary endosymbiont of Ctenarytaina eucalypti]